MTSYWKIIVPTATTNICTNPSFETVTTGWTTGGTNTIARSATQQRRGVYSLLCTYSNNDVLASYAATLTAASYSIGIDVYIPSTYTGTQITAALVGYTSATGTLTKNADMTILDAWQRLEFTAVPNASYLVGTLEVQETGTNGTGFIYIDGVQIEQQSTPTTYTDTTRDALDSTGGEVKDMADDFGFRPSDWDGGGMPPVNNLSSPLALRPGSLFEDQTIDYRQLIINGTIVGTTPQNFHDQKRALIAALNPSTVKISKRAEPRTLRHTGTTEQKEIKVVYDGGLERGLPMGWVDDDIKLRLKADDPLYRQIGNSAVVLDTQDTTASSSIIRRVDGLWDTMGTLSGTVYALEEDSTYVYIGYSVSPYIKRYNKSTGVLSDLGAGLNGECRALFLSGGKLYVGGDFTTAGGAGANRIAYWTGSAWVSMGSGLNDVCYAICYGGGNSVYIAGAFTTAGGAGANRIVKWDHTTTAYYVFSDTGTNGTIFCMDSLNYGSALYIGGLFTTANGVTVNNVCRYIFGTTAFAMGDGLNAQCDTLKMYGLYEIYAGGNFTTAGGVTVNYVADWNGSAWSAMGSGLSARCYGLELSSDGNLYAGGAFTIDGLIGSASWNGSVWGNLGVSKTGTIPVRTILDSTDGNLYIGGDAGVVQSPGTVTVDYYGTYHAYPVVKVSRDGGTTANLVRVINNTTGALLSFDYPLADGETLTIDTTPGQQSIVSSSLGNVYSALSPSSDFGNFFIMAGNTIPQTNSFSCLVISTGSPTILATMTYQTTYVSED